MEEEEQEEKKEEQEQGEDGVWCRSECLSLLHFDMLMVCGRKGGLQTLIQRSGVVLSSLCASSPPSLLLLRHQQNSGSNSSGSLWACDNRAKVQFCLQEENKTA